MPLPIAHGFIGASIVAAIHPRPMEQYFMPLLAGTVLANCADLDFFLVWLFHSRAWHRAFTHSLSFALIFFLASLIVLGAAHLKEVLAYGLAFMSHGLTDYATTKVGGGIELLWPFSSARFSLGVVGLSEFPSRFSAIEILKALTGELVIFLPLFLLVLLTRHLISNSKFFPPHTI